MSKKYKGKLCAYCAKNLSFTGDHIFARSFFLEDRRANLPKVPACNQCNADKSNLEHYLATVLPFGGRHVDAKKNLQFMVPGRLSRNEALSKQLSQAVSPVWHSNESGLVVPSYAIDFNQDNLQKLIELIVRGLSWHHWKVYLQSSTFVDVHFLGSGGRALYARYLGLGSAKSVDVDLGQGTFRYSGRQSMDNNQITLWAFEVYGGIIFSDGTKDGDASVIAAFSGPTSVKRRALRRKYLADWLSRM